MPTGYTRRDKGKWAAGAIAIGGASPHAGVNATLEQILAVTAVANTDFICSVPSGATILSASVTTTVAFTGATATIQIGSTAGGVDYVAATTIKAAGVFPLTLVAAALLLNLYNMPSPPNLFVRIVQTATFTAVGSGSLFVQFTT